eukprot:scaffold5769_cov402-Prasinococcus_capsulatus_cf.AAC.10
MGARQLIARPALAPRRAGGGASFDHPGQAPRTRGGGRRWRPPPAPLFSSLPVPGGSANWWSGRRESAAIAHIRTNGTDPGARGASGTIRCDLDAPRRRRSSER